MNDAMGKLKGRGQSGERDVFRERMSGHYCRDFVALAGVLAVPIRFDYVFVGGNSTFIMVTPRSLSIITRLINNYLQKKESQCCARSRRKQDSVALEVATKELGYRPNQEAAIRNFLGGKDLFVSLSTGAGNPSATVYFQECTMS